jgi:transcription-repair coupling factor (superfamily II helicase)
MYAEEIARNNKFVKETSLETDFELLIPDEYVSSITERIALYKEMDDLDNDESMETFRNQLLDRFGPIPAAAQALLETMRVRWMAREIGMEKLVLKSGKMIGYFVTKQDSPYYQSEKFSTVLEFIKHNPIAGKMYEKDQSLRISFNEIRTIPQAVHILRSMLNGTKL